MGNTRKYLIYKDAQEKPEVKPLFDGCVDAVLTGEARMAKTRPQAGYPQHPCFRHEGAELLPNAVLEYYLQ